MINITELNIFNNIVAVTMMNDDEISLLYCMCIEEAENFYGMYDIDRCMIIINKGIKSYTTLKQTIIHELTHACSNLLCRENFMINEEEMCMFMENYGEYIIKTALDIYEKCNNYINVGINIDE